MPQQLNLFKKVADLMKRNPHITRKDAFAIVQGKKKMPARSARVSGIKRKAAPKRAAAAPKRKTVTRVVATKSVSLGSMLTKAKSMLADKVGELEKKKFLATKKSDKNRIAKEIRATKAQYNKLK